MHTFKLAYICLISLSEFSFVNDLKLTYLYTSIAVVSTQLNGLGGARGVMVIVLGNGHGDTSLNPGRDWLHFI